MIQTLDAPNAGTSLPRWPERRNPLEFYSVNPPTELAIPLAPFGGRSSFPNLKGAKERIGIFKAEQERGFIELHGALFQIMPGKFAARVFNELLKGHACVSQATLQRAGAQA